MAERGAGGLRGLPFQISVEDIDRLLTSDSDIRRSSLWVPQSARDFAESAGSAEHGAAAHARPQPHGVPSASRSGIAAAAPVAYEMGPPGERGELPAAAPSYGAVHIGGAPGEGSLPARYKRIEKVALSIGVVCSMIFVVSLSGETATGSSTSSTLAGRAQNKASEGVAGCGTFLCPSSGHCVAAASLCPEGNPFLKANSVYQALVECADKTELCTQTAGATGIEFKDKKVETVLAAQGRRADGKFKSCDGFLCPQSGSCRIAPANCTEGDPFASRTSLYWKEALAAKAQLLKGVGNAVTKTKGTAVIDKGGSEAAKRLFHGHIAAKVAAMAVPKKLSAKQLEQQEVKSEAASLEKSDAASMHSARMPC